MFHVMLETVLEKESLLNVSQNTYVFLNNLLIIIYEYLQDTLDTIRPNKTRLMSCNQFACAGADRPLAISQ